MSYDNPSNDGILEDAINEAIRDQLINTFVSLPATIVSFDAEKQTASVQLSIMRSLNGSVSNISVLQDLPVVFPRSGGYAITMPVDVGDSCHVMFADRSLDAWHLNGGVQNPNDTRIHDISDGIVYLGLNPLPNALKSFNSDNLEIRNTDGSTKISLSQNRFDVNNSTQSLMQILHDLIMTLYITRTDVTMRWGKNKFDLDTKQIFLQLLSRLDELKL